MASAVASARTLVPAFGIASLATTAYYTNKAARSDWRKHLRDYFTGPGRISRILLLFLVLTNLKSLPFAWTFRIFGGMIRHRIRMRRALPPQAIFHYSISTSRTSLLETDYNFHKSNSTYFADLDASRTHLMMHLLGSGFKLAEDNARSRLVRDKEGRVVAGPFGVGLGAVFCSFRKEILPLQGYEMWSRVLAWDRKWVFILTHFVVKGKVKPRSWDGGSTWGQHGGLRRPGAADAGEEELQKHVIATAISKYVFKLGRFTVHPAYILESSGVLPQRPGEGWMGGETGIGTPDELGEVDETDGVWDWKRVEWERRKGMRWAEQFAALDGTNGLFDGGKDGALGRFAPG